MNKEQEGDIADTISKLYSMIDYWKKRCEAAEFILSQFDRNIDKKSISYKEWQEFKNQQP